MERNLRVLYLPSDDGGCGHHRMRMWDKAFNDYKLADSVTLDPSEDERMTKAAIEYADVVVSRLNTLEYFKLIKKTYHKKVVVFDHDDNTLETKPSNPAYKDFGTIDAWIPIKDVKSTEYYKQASIGVKLQMEKEGAVPLWVTGITDGFNRFNNLEFQTGLIYALTACNLATAPTPRLTQLWGKYSELVAVVPNCLDFKYYPDVEVKRKRSKGEVRIGWSGGSSHSADLKTIIPTLLELKKKYNIKLVISGSHFPELFDRLGGLVEYHAWTKWEAHPYRMKLLDLDMAIIPLADDESFNIYKSELKMMEFAGLKVPMIIKDQEPYAHYIERNKNCLAYKDDKELMVCFEKMISGKADRENLIKNAYNWVKTHRDIEKIAPEVVNVYKSLLPENTQKLIK